VKAKAHMINHMGGTVHTISATIDKSFSRLKMMV